MSEEMIVYDWDDEITSDGGDMTESVVLPEGVYNFEVIKMEKSYYNGGGKLSACNVAKMFLRIDGGPAGKGLCVENLYLCDRCEWKAAEFLHSIGLKKHGEPVAWRKLAHCEGETGRCQIYVDEYTGNDGKTKQSNKVRKFLEKAEPKANGHDVPRDADVPKPKFTRGAF